MGLPQWKDVCLLFTIHLSMCRLTPLKLVPSSSSEAAGTAGYQGIGAGMWLLTDTSPRTTDPMCSQLASSDKFGVHAKPKRVWSIALDSFCHVGLTLTASGLINHAGPADNWTTTSSPVGVAKLSCHVCSTFNLAPLLSAPKTSFYLHEKTHTSLYFYLFWDLYRLNVLPPDHPNLTLWA